MDASISHLASKLKWENIVIVILGNEYFLGLNIRLAVCETICECVREKFVFSAEESLRLVEIVGDGLRFLIDPQWDSSKNHRMLD